MLANENTNINAMMATATVAESPNAGNAAIACELYPFPANAQPHAHATLRSSSTSAIWTSTAASCSGVGGGVSNYQRQAFYATSTFATCCNGAAAAATTNAGALPFYARPRSLNVRSSFLTPAQQTQLFFGEVLNAWRSKARHNVVPAEHTQELFHELNFHPSHKQISEMLQTAKKATRKGSGGVQDNGLTFGQFCVLAADLKRFRSSKFCETQTKQKPDAQATTDCPAEEHADGGVTLRPKRQQLQQQEQQQHTRQFGGNELRSTRSFSCVEDSKKKAAASELVEVFLGGSCNPTTWRADVAIPALKELGISFYNPQVSDWTPDLIELEHRAKEKARVLFFVMDSETRASAGAIEAAHIASQNCKQLVLVLHPYKPNQNILNEPISQQEYYDLRRNQLILKELVTRRGLPVLDNIPAGLQRTKDILAGIQHPPNKISSILDAVRGAFDRVNPEHEQLTLAQCRRALIFLGYPQSLLNLDNLNKILLNQRETLKLLQARASERKAQAQVHALYKTKESSDMVDFELFCMISAYLSVLQQETSASGCTSPIKGTNVLPPPVYFTNADVDIYYNSLNISRNSSNASVPSIDLLEHQSVVELLSRNRDSGTSSPQPLGNNLTAASLSRQARPQIMFTADSLDEASGVNTNATTRQLNDLHHAVEAEESDSNDSVFSSNSSIASVANITMTTMINDGYCYDNLELRDVYLGGSCVLRTNWRQQIAVPYLKTKGITFHFPALQESIRELNDSELDDNWHAAAAVRSNLYNPALLDTSRVLLFVISNETRSLAPMTLAAHCIGLMYNVVLAVQMLPPDCVIGGEQLTSTAIKDYNRGRSYLIDLAKRQGVPVFTEIQTALDSTAEKIHAMHNRKRAD